MLVIRVIQQTVTRYALVEVPDGVESNYHDLRYAVRESNFIAEIPQWDVLHEDPQLIAVHGFIHKDGHATMEIGEPIWVYE